MLLIILIGFLAAIGILTFNNIFKKRIYNWAFILPLSLFIIFSLCTYYVHSEHVILYKYEWIQKLKIGIDFRLDGLSLMFSLMITGIGALIFKYAAGYLKGHKYIDRFFTYLTLFMSAMLGLVMSDNLLVLFIFWELTSISSFFLIGFNNDQEDSRKSALLSLGITGLGGFLLLAAIVLIAHATDSYSLTYLLKHPNLLINSEYYNIIIFLIFGAAFTKSAQFPFHFWLPGAMKAPTPVSAYLHSATMVKAGIYLLARFTPILGDTDIWNTTLLIVGGVTMLYSAINTLFKTDLKGVLAYSTIAALGMMVFLLGIGTQESIVAAITFILVHAIYKATLFLITGIIDHQTHTRNVTILSGLNKIMPKVGYISIIAALSNAGIPLTFGFIGKDLIYEAEIHNAHQYSQIFLWITIITNILIGYAGYVAGIKPFIGTLPEKLNKTKHPYKSLWIPAGILSLFSIIFGLLPNLPNYLFIKYAIQSVTQSPFRGSLKIWHGFNMTLFYSVLTIIVGLIIFYIYKPTKAKEDGIDSLYKLSPKGILEQLTELFRKFAFLYTRFLHNGYLRVYLIFIILFTTILVGYRLFTEVPLKVNTDNLSEFRLYELVVVGIMLVAIGIVVSTSSRLTSIAGMSIVGYCICLIFIFYGAPDLAMTQFTIDTLTVVLFMLVMYKLPNYLNFNNWKIQIRDAIIAIAFGSLISLITLQALVSPANKTISHYYAENAYTVAKGKNVVNVILVDFRGFDTLIESIVLSIAAIGVYSMLKQKPDPEDKY